jgi:hypothetical protein
MALNDLADQVQVIAIMLKEMFPGNRIFSGVDGFDWVTFWQWPDEKELFRVKRGPDVVTTREDLEKLVPADRVIMHHDHPLPPRPKQEKKHWWFRKKTIPGEIDGYPMSKMHHIYRCVHCKREFLSSFPEWKKPPEDKCDPSKKFKSLPKVSVHPSDKLGKDDIFELQRRLTRLDYKYYVLNISEVPDQEYDRLDKRFHALLEEYPEVKLPHHITRSLEAEDMYPQWVRAELGKPLPKGRFF